MTEPAVRTIEFDLRSNGADRRTAYGRNPTATDKPYSSADLKDGASAALAAKMRPHGRVRVADGQVIYADVLGDQPGDWR